MYENGILVGYAVAMTTDRGAFYHNYKYSEQ